jgi:hypothetical protein
MQNQNLIESLSSEGKFYGLKTEISEKKVIGFPAINKTILYYTVHITNHNAPAQNICNNAK